MKRHREDTTQQEQILRNLVAMDRTIRDLVKVDCPACHAHFAVRMWQVDVSALAAMRLLDTLDPDMPVRDLLDLLWQVVQTHDMPQEAA